MQNMRGATYKPYDRDAYCVTCSDRFINSMSSSLKLKKILRLIYGFTILLSRVGLLRARNDEKHVTLTLSLAFFLSFADGRKGYLFGLAILACSRPFFVLKKNV